jgi:N6-L-threonylcarbamoyladenine synthase
MIAFSLSGLKNAVRLTIESLGGYKNMTYKDKCNLSASFQKSIKLHLIQKSKKIFKTNKTKDFAIVGGASANLYIRKAYEDLCSEFEKKLHTVSLKYCSDNSAMIGRCAIEAYKKNLFIDPYKIDITHTKKLKAGDYL